MPSLTTVTILPSTTVFLPTPVIHLTVPIIPLPSINDATDILIYSGGGGSKFPFLPMDNMLEQGLYHGGNPLITKQLQVPSYDMLNINVTTKDIFSNETEKGIFNIEYPVSGSTIGKINYFWDEVYTTPLGIYTHSGTESPLDIVTNVTKFNLNNETLKFFTNDVNVIPKINDYIVFNYVSSSFFGYINGNLPKRLPYFKGNECYLAQIKNVIITGGTGILTAYTLEIDKSFKFANSEKYAIILLNRKDTSIQKELFYETFEQIEIQRQQLLGDPYDNTTSTALPYGKMNYLNYNGSDSLGVANLLKGIINNNNTPIIIFDANDNIKDRISFNGNTYDVNLKPTNIHFEFHLPTVLIDNNTYPLISTSGDITENIFITNPDYNTILHDTSIGKYSGLYLKTDTLFKNRFGWVLYDLRIAVFDDPELVTALSYNSNRNYTLPSPKFITGSGNNLTNIGTGTNLNIINASNTSPIIITTSTPYNLPRGTQLFISGVLGNTAANGDYFITEVYGASNIYQFELWHSMPDYIGTVRTLGSGIPVNGTTSGIFINNGVGYSGQVISGLPSFSYFYTYRLRNLRNNSVMPYSCITPFNFALSGIVNNTLGSLSINIPEFKWYNQQSLMFINDNGFQMKNSSDGYGIDIIIGKYITNPLDLVNPTTIIGTENIMCIPITNLINTFTGNPLIGINIIIDKTDYNNAITSSSTIGLTNYTFDLLNNMPLYTYNPGYSLSNTLLSGNGLWTLGNIIYKNHVTINTAKMSVKIPADSWNSSTNPTYTPSTNGFITNKYISEIGLLLDVDSVGYNDMSPMIYAKISPAVKKSQSMDLQIDISLDY